MTMIVCVFAGALLGLLAGFVAVVVEWHRLACQRRTAQADALALLEAIWGRDG